MPLSVAIKEGCPEILELVHPAIPFLVAVLQSRFLKQSGEDVVENLQWRHGGV
jgi:hypothetical protein